MRQIKVLPHIHELLTAEEKFLLLQGGIGSGKSYGLGDLLMKYRHENHKNEILICANTHKQIRDSTIKAITERLSMYGLFEGEHFEYAENKGYFDLMGMRSYLRPLDNIDKAIAGLTVDKILCDEYAFIGRPNLSPDYIHKKLIQRLRGKNGKNQFVAVTSPNGINFLNEIWVTHKTREHRFIQCKTKDNIFLPDGYYESLLAAYGCFDEAGEVSDEPQYLSAIAKQELFGEFINIQENNVYYAYDEKRHNGKTKRVDGTVYVGLDFNVEPMCGVAVQMINGKFHVIDEFVIENNADTYKMADLLIKKGYKGAKIIPDSTGKNRKTSGKSDHQILRDYGFSIEYVTNPIVFDRVNNMNRHFIENNIIIGNENKWLKRDLTKVRWKNGKLDQTTDRTLVHATDALGYVLWKLAPIKVKYGSKISTSRY